MPQPESPQVRNDRMSALVATAIVCLTLPSVALLVYDVPGTTALRRVPVFWFLAAGVVGASIPFLYWARYRALGFVAFASSAWVLATAHGAYWHEWPGWPHGLALGLIVGALARGRRGPESVEDNYALVGAVIVGFCLAWGFVVAERPFTSAGYFVLAASVALAFWAWTRLFRPAFEMGMEPITWLAFHIRGRGPGLANFPLTGPCLLIANHACWFDPLFLAKVAPRPVTPMMTERFYDLPILRWLMRAFGVIRVTERAIKKNAPEIQDAIAALDRGECVVIFPEGYLRRTEDRPLRRFGQGVWQILQARPETPVFACWLEGSWGTYTSYYNGPPTKRKKRDFRRPIMVGVSEMVTVPVGVLAEHLQTRIYLMNLVAAARLHLGLPALPRFELPAKGDDE